MKQISLIDTNRTLHLAEGQLFTCWHGVPEGDYGFANDYASGIVSRLTDDQKDYAGDPARGECRGFAALHDLMDANMILPYADESEEGEFGEMVREFWKEWNPVQSDIIIKWWEMVENEVTRQLIALHDEKRVSDLIAALEAVDAVLGKDSRWKVSDLRLKVVRAAISKAKGE